MQKLWLDSCLGLTRISVFWRILPPTWTQLGTLLDAFLQRLSNLHPPENERIRPLKIGTILKGNESFSNHQCSGDVLVFSRVVHKENKVAFNVGMKWWRRTGTQGRCLVLKRTQEPCFCVFWSAKKLSILYSLYTPKTTFFLFYFYILSKFWRQMQYINVYIYIYRSEYSEYVCIIWEA